MHETTHITKDREKERERSACLDLNFVSQPNFLMESGVNLFYIKLSSPNSVCNI